MANFTITSWDQRSPEHFGDYEIAVATARIRAAREGSAVRLRDNRIDETRMVRTDGSTGPWHHANKPDPDRDDPDRDDTEYCI